MVLVLFGILIIALAIGIPISISLGVAVFAVIIQMGNSSLFPMIAQRMFTSLDSFSLMAVPFFILAGDLMERGGISRRLIAFAKILLSRTPAALATICTAASAFFGAISGSNPATVAAIGGIMVPEMKKVGYPADRAGAAAAASGTLGVVIPPSIPMVTYAITAGVSIGTVFMAGFIPGLFLAIGIVIANVVTCKKFETKSIEKVTVSTFWKAFSQALLALIMPIIILGGIYGGIFTPTEASSVACIYAFIISVFVYKELKLSDLMPIFAKSAMSSAIVLFVVSLSAPFAWLMTSTGITGTISSFVLGSIQNKYLILLALNIILLFLGCFLETQSIILLTTPILLPIATSVGLDPVALGIIIIVNTSIGMITPPMSVNLFVASSVSKATIEQLSRRILPYLAAEILVLMAITYFPDIIMFLPNILAK